MSINRDIFSAVAASDSARVSANQDLSLREVNRWFSEGFQMVLPESLGFDSFERYGQDSFGANGLYLGYEFGFSWRMDGISKLLTKLAEREGFYIEHGRIGCGTYCLSVAINRGNVMAILQAKLGNPCYNSSAEKSEAKTRESFQEALQFGRFGKV